MALELNAQPPAWLLKASEEAQDPLRSIRQAQAAANLSETLLQATSMQQQLLSKAQDDRDKALDMAELPKWLREHPKYEDRENTPYPVPKSQWGKSIIEGWQNHDFYSSARQQQLQTKRQMEQSALEAQKIQGRLTAKDIDADTKTIAELDKLGGDTRMFRPYMGKPFPPQIKEALGVALQAQREHIANEQALRKLEADEARARGDTVTEHAGKDGQMVYTIKPKSPDKAAKPPAKIQEVDEAARRRAEAQKAFDSGDLNRAKELRRQADEISAPKVDTALRSRKLSIQKAVDTAQRALDTALATKDQKTITAAKANLDSAKKQLADIEEQERLAAQGMSDYRKNRLKELENEYDPKTGISKTGLSRDAVNRTTPAQAKAIIEASKPSPWMIDPNAPKPTEAELIKLMGGTNDDPLSLGVYR